MSYHPANVMGGDSIAVAKRGAKGHDGLVPYPDVQSFYAQALSNNICGQPGLVPAAAPMQLPMYAGPPYSLDGQMLFGLGGQALGAAGGAENLYAAYPSSYVPHAGSYGSYVPFPAVIPYTTARGQKDLENRQASYSTNESSPATPYYGGVAQREAAPRVAVVDRSRYTTPSPRQVTGAASAAPKAQTAVQYPIDTTLDEILKKKPEIPRAVPAVFTPLQQMKSLEQSLENRIPGNRNVYIRGLHPTTDDDLLLAYASRFGRVETSKAIIDTNTGACKGFGFAKFYDVRDSELCIRGFHRLGYEVGFARESFNSRLKAEGDEASTNLYISNLPKNVDEVALAAIFTGYHILSSKILRDSMGNSRGVGFARFETRDMCDDIIRKFNGTVTLGEENLVMQVRYADTPSQKELKRVTAERRQFRTNEYNIGAYGTALVGIHPSTFQRPGWNRPAASSSHRAVSSASAPVSKFSEVDRLDVSKLTISEHASDDEEKNSPTPVVVNGSAQASPTSKNEK